jgi:hypothetical protein
MQKGWFVAIELKIESEAIDSIVCSIEGCIYAESKNSEEEAAVTEQRQGMERQDKTQP